MRKKIHLQEDEATDDPFQGLEDEEEDPFTNLEESEDGEDHAQLNISGKVDTSITFGWKGEGVTLILVVYILMP